MSLFKHKEATYVWSFGKSNRDQDEDRTLKINGKQIRLKKKSSQNPGPGKYDPVKVNLKRPASYRIGKERRFDYNNHHKKLPGVGAYDVFYISGSDFPKFSILGKGHVKEKQKNLPGPGRYDPDYSQVKESHPKYRIRPKTCLTDTMISRISKSYINQPKTPGPGSYKPKPSDFEEKRRGSKFGKEEKFRNLKFTYETTPGSGCYSISDDLKVSTSMKVSIPKSHTSRSKVSINRTTPGPGSYHKEDINTSEKYTIGKKRGNSGAFDSKTMSFPGPTTYFNNNSYQPSTSQIKFPKEERKGLELKHTLKSPNVLKYNPDYTLTRERPLTCKIGKEKREGIKLSYMTNPGTGKYNIEGQIGNYGPKYSINKLHSTTSQLSKNDNQNKSLSSLIPGPDKYDNSKNNVLYRAAGWKFDKSSRDALVYKKEVPGPGRYDPEIQKTNKSIFIEKSSRKPLTVSNNPGPGFYKIPYSLFDFPGFVPVNGFDVRYKYI